MSTGLKKIILYIKKLLENKEKFSLKKLIKEFIEDLEGYKTLPEPHVFRLLDPYCQETVRLLEDYERKKKDFKNPLKRKRIKELTAKHFFEILEKLGAIVPKWLSVIPGSLSSNEFPDWKSKIKSKGFKNLADIVKNPAQLRALKIVLSEVANTLVFISSNIRLRKLVDSELKRESRELDKLAEKSFSVSTERRKSE